MKKEMGFTKSIVFDYVLDKYVSYRSKGIRYGRYSTELYNMDYLKFFTTRIYYFIECNSYYLTGSGLILVRRLLSEHPDNPKDYAIDKITHLPDLCDPEYFQILDNWIEEAIKEAANEPTNH